MLSGKSEGEGSANGTNRGVGVLVSANPVTKKPNVRRAVLRARAASGIASLLSAAEAQLFALYAAKIAAAECSLTGNERLAALNRLRAERDAALRELRRRLRGQEQRQRTGHAYLYMRPEVGGDRARSTMLQNQGRSSIKPS